MKRKSYRYRASRNNTVWHFYIYKVFSDNSVLVITEYAKQLRSPGTWTDVDDELTIPITEKEVMLALL